MLIKIVQNGIESDWFQLTKKAHRELIKKKPEAAVIHSTLRRQGRKRCTESHRAADRRAGHYVQNAAQLNQVVTNLIEATDEIVSKDKSKE